jgi:hypothetical protein
MVATIAGGDMDGGFTECESLGDAGLSSGPAYCTAYATSASTIFEGEQPTANISGVVAYGVPFAFEEFLSAKYSASLPSPLLAGNHLIDQGVVIGYVIDQNGKPVVGATLNTTVNTMVPTVQYVDDNYNPVTSATAGTNDYGVFLVIAPGSPDDYPTPFSLTLANGQSGQSTFGCHKLGSNPNSVFVLVYDASNPGECN